MIPLPHSSRYFKILVSQPNTPALLRSVFYQAKAKFYYWSRLLADRFPIAQRLQDLTGHLSLLRLADHGDHFQLIRNNELKLNEALLQSETERRRKHLINDMGAVS